MLPFNIISELSRHAGLSRSRLFGNMMSGTMILRHLADHHALHLSDRHECAGLLTGMVQAYIFSILAAVYIAAATRGRKSKPEPMQDIKA